MAGIYVHVPFCKKACHYCNFHFSTSLQLKNEFVAALLKEIKLRFEYIGDEIIETIYFGGGTPSLLSFEELARILQTLRLQYRVADEAEVTLEANPDDINDQKLQDWKVLGINRLSIGVQSFFEEDLKWMNRAHTAEQSIKAIRSAQQHGFHNLTIDLIFGTPALTDERWQENVKMALSLDVPHLSCYALTVEPSTALYKMIEKKKSADVIPDDQARQFLLLMGWLAEAGYEQYEISNYAKPGCRSRHNSSYWQGKKYLGLGPSAHSFDGVSRQWNVANNALYSKGIEHGHPQIEAEVLTNKQQLNEYIMISLRTVEGISLPRLSQRFGQSAVEQLIKGAERFSTKGQVEITLDTIRLTTEGKLFADGIAGELFV